MSRSRSNRNLRFIVGSERFLLQSLKRWLRPATDNPVVAVEYVYFDDDLLSLRPESCARATRRWATTPEGGGEDLYVVELPKTSTDRDRAGQEPRTLADATAVLRRAHGLSRLVPYCMVRFLRHQYQLGDFGTLIVDTAVEYFSLIGDTPIRTGQESDPRVHVELEGRPGPKFELVLAGMRRLPHISKRWVAYHHMKKQVKPPCINELQGYEYEVKLHSEGDDIDPTCLPFPIVAVFKTESIRHYFSGYRVSVHLARATLTRKGVVEVVGGVLRREEEKERELSAWILEPSPHAMRRIKKTYILVNLASQRLYNLNIEYCRAQQSMSQIEIEYIGIRRTPDGTFKIEPGLARDEVETAVVTDLIEIRDCLIKRHGLNTTRMTKRQWLRQQYAGAA